MNELNVNRLMETLSDILSEKHGAKVTLRVSPKGTDNKEERR